MQKWEYTAYYFEYSGRGKPALWQNKGKNGRSAWDDIEDLGKEGWELVNHDEGLFVFKRPIGNGSSSGDS